MAEKIESILGLQLKLNLPSANCESRSLVVAFNHLPLFSFIITSSNIEQRAQAYVRHQCHRNPCELFFFANRALIIM